MFFFIISAFVTTDGVLVVAVAFKKEYLAVPLEDFPLNDEKWHSIEIVHSKVSIDSHLKHYIRSLLLKRNFYGKFTQQNK